LVLRPRGGDRLPPLRAGRAPARRLRPGRRGPGGPPRGRAPKNGKAAEQPIPPTLAAALCSWLAPKARGKPVFALPEKTGPQILHADLRRCGIEPVDAEGRVVDTHSLRHGSITALARAGVPVKVVQTLARHSDPKLTRNLYSHLSAFDLHGAIDHLPDLTASGHHETNAMAATGTEGRGATPGATLPITDDPLSLPGNQLGQEGGSRLISGLKVRVLRGALPSASDRSRPEALPSPWVVRRCSRPRCGLGPRPRPPGRRNRPPTVRAWGGRERRAPQGRGRGGPRRCRRSNRRWPVPSASRRVLPRRTAAGPSLPPRRSVHHWRGFTPP
jgi:hypothetical protein